MRTRTLLGEVETNIFLAGNRIETISSQWEGGRLVSKVVRPISNIYGIEIRLIPNKAEHTSRALWSGTVETALNTNPQLPEEATIFLNALRVPAAQQRRAARLRK